MIKIEVKKGEEIIDGKLHIHVVLGREDKSALFGHLHLGKVKAWFVHVYIIPLHET